MNRAIVITGTASGLGKATVGRFATAGWNVEADPPARPDDCWITGSTIPSQRQTTSRVRRRRRVHHAGQQATKIFTKIDAASDVAGDYQAGIGSFFAATRTTGSSPSVTANVIYQAVLDPQVTRVRYYSGPDSVAIPTAEQVPGPQQYWEEFREAAVGRPTALIPVPGSQPLQQDV